MNKFVGDVWAQSHSMFLYFLFSIMGVQLSRMELIHLCFFSAHGFDNRHTTVCHAGLFELSFHSYCQHLVV